MTYIHLSKDLSLTVTHYENICRGDNLSSLITFLIPLTVDEVEVETATVYLHYIRPDGSADTITLNPDETMYNSDYYKYSIPVTCELTRQHGNVRMWLEFYAGDPSNPIVKKSDECNLPILDTESMDECLGDCQIGALYQMQQDIRELKENPPSSEITEETDPTVPAWAKESTKPSYTADEVGAIQSPSSASIGQTVVVKEVDENGKPIEWETASLLKQVQVDWYQNDVNAPDYVKNRIAYTECRKVEIFPESNVEFTAQTTNGVDCYSGNIDTSVISNVNPGDYLVIVLDGVQYGAEYKLLGEYYNTGIHVYGLGNLSKYTDSFVDATYDSSVPIGLFYFPGGTPVGANYVEPFVELLTYSKPVDADTSSPSANGHYRTVKIFHDTEVIHPIDPKYLPDGGFGYGGISVLYQCTLENVDDISMYREDVSPLTLEVGKTYTITTDSGKFTAVCKNDGDVKYIGNLDIFGDEDTGESFLVITLDDDSDGIDELVVADFNCGTFMSISDEDIHYINPKYLPEGSVGYANTTPVLSGELTDGVYTSAAEGFIKPGETYSIRLDNGTYTGVAKQQGSGCVYVGNLALLNVNLPGANTGETWLVCELYYDETHTFGVVDASEGKHFSLEVENVHYIDSKYLNIDTELNPDSKNPVQNAAVASALDRITQAIDDIKGDESNQIVSVDVGEPDSDGIYEGAPFALCHKDGNFFTESIEDLLYPLQTEIERIDQDYDSLYAEIDEVITHLEETHVRAPEVASVGQTIVVKAVDENGKPTEWETKYMPDESALKDAVVTDLSDSGKIGSEAMQKTVILPQTDAVFATASDGACIYIIPESFELVVGSEYMVILDGVTYKFVAEYSAADDEIRLGNSDTAEPFCIAISSDGTAGLIVLTGGTHTVAIYQQTEIIHPIAPKYLPGVCLPVVEITTVPDLENLKGVNLTEAECAKMDKVSAELLPCVVRFVATNTTAVCACIASYGDNGEPFATYCFYSNGIGLYLEQRANIKNGIHEWVIIIRAE